MFPLFESIKLLDGLLFNLPLHQARMERSCKIMYNKFVSTHQLEEILTNFPKQGLYKCRVRYNASNYDIEYIPYTPKKIQSLYLIHDNTIEYNLKYSNRFMLNKHNSDLSKNEDIIIVKNDLLTDSSYSNLALWNGNEWHTPQTPLLGGTKREYYLKTGKLITKEIKVTDLQGYERISLINAMLDLGDIEVPISSLKVSLK